MGQLSPVKPSVDTAENSAPCDNESSMITTVKQEKENKMKIFLFKPTWRKVAYIIPICSGPYGNPALMRNDPFR